MITDHATEIGRNKNTTFACLVDSIKTKEIFAWLGSLARQTRHATRLGSLVRLTRPWSWPFGEFGRSLNASSSHGLQSTLGFGGMIALQRRGWPNCNTCPLCKKVQESVAHLLFQCRYTIRVWCMIKDWLGLHDVHPPDWGEATSVKEWWTYNATKKTQLCRPLASLMLLISWALWKEWNARIFLDSFVPMGVIVTRIKEDTSLWSIAEARHLSIVM